MNTLIIDKLISHIAHYFKETQPEEELEFEFGKSSSKTLGLQYHKITTSKHHYSLHGAGDTA